MAPVFVPHHRMPVRALNRTLGGLRALGVKRRPLDAGRMLAWARRMTGLKDFGDPAFEEPLRLLVDDINADSDLHEAGRLFHWYFISGFLRNRLRLVEAWKRHPDVLQQSVAAPLIILGLPRTATTRLFNVLAADPNHRTLTFWEAVSPVKPKSEGFIGLHTRRAKARLMLGATHFLAPNFRSIHELHLEGPEECIHMLGNSMASWIFPVEYNAPRYTAWFDTADHTFAYNEFRAQLQLLQIQKKTGRWLLKSPHHIFGLDALLKAFPDAMIIQTHRDPAKVVPSTCSLAQTTRGIASAQLDPHLLGSQICGQLALGLERAASERTRLSPAQVIDIHYRDIVGDPMGVVDKIYQHFDLPMNDEARRAIEAEIGVKTQNKHGKHGYTLEQFGLTAEGLDDAFGPYCKTFNVLREGE